MGRTKFIQSIKPQLAGTDNSNNCIRNLSIRIKPPLSHDQTVMLSNHTVQAGSRIYPGPEALPEAGYTSRRSWSWSLMIECEWSIIFLTYHAIFDHPLLPSTGYLHIQCWLVENSPAGLILVNKKQEWSSAWMSSISRAMALPWNCFHDQEISKPL
jgi:hypothetical protein